MGMSNKSRKRRLVKVKGRSILCVDNYSCEPLSPSRQRAALGEECLNDECEDEEQMKDRIGRREEEERMTQSPDALIGSINLHMELASKKREVSHLVDEMQRLQSSINNLKEISTSKIAQLQDAVTEKDRVIKDLAEKLLRQQDYTDLKRELRLLKALDMGGWQSWGTEQIDSGSPTNDKTPPEPADTNGARMTPPSEDESGGGHEEPSSTSTPPLCLIGGPCGLRVHRAAAALSPHERGPLLWGIPQHPHHCAVRSRTSQRQQHWTETLCQVGTVSELLSKPKPWDKLTEKGRDSYRKMHAWACDQHCVMLLKSLLPKKGREGSSKPEPEDRTAPSNPEATCPTSSSIEDTNNNNPEVSMASHPHMPHKDMRHHMHHVGHHPMYPDVMNGSKAFCHYGPEFPPVMLAHIYQEELLKLIGKRMKEGQPEDQVKQAQDEIRQALAISPGTDTPGCARNPPSRSFLPRVSHAQETGLRNPVLSRPARLLSAPSPTSPPRSWCLLSIGCHEGAVSLFRSLPPSSHCPRGTADLQLGGILPLQRMQSITNSLLNQAATPSFSTLPQRPMKAVLPPITQQQFDHYNNLNTEDIVKRVKEQLSQYSISQRLFGGKCLGAVARLRLRPVGTPQTVAHADTEGTGALHSHEDVPGGRERRAQAGRLAVQDRPREAHEDGRVRRGTRAARNTEALDNSQRVTAWQDPTSSAPLVQQNQHSQTTSKSLRNPPTPLRRNPHRPLKVLQLPSPHTVHPAARPTFQWQPEGCGAPGRKGQQMPGPYVQPSVYEMAAVTTDLDTQIITARIKETLTVHNIGQKLFGEAVLGLSQGSVSELLSKPKPWHMLSIKGREPFIRMQLWLNDPSNVEKLQAIKTERREANKRRRNALDTDGPSPLLPCGDQQQQFPLDPIFLYPSSAKKPRILFSEEQKEALKLAYNLDPYPSTAVMEFLSAELGLSVRTITNWFHNHRMRLKQQNQEPEPPPYPPPENSTSFDPIRFRLLLGQRLAEMCKSQQGSATQMLPYFSEAQRAMCPLPGLSGVPLPISKPDVDNTLDLSVSSHQYPHKEDKVEKEDDSDRRSTESAPTRASSSSSSQLTHPAAIDLTPSADKPTSSFSSRMSPLGYPRASSTKSSLDLSFSTFQKLGSHDVQPSSTAHNLSLDLALRNTTPDIEAILRSSSARLEFHSGNSVMDSPVDLREEKRPNMSASSTSGSSNRRKPAAPQWVDPGLDLSPDSDLVGFDDEEDDDEDTNEVLEASSSGGGSHVINGVCVRQTDFSSRSAAMDSVLRIEPNELSFCNSNKKDDEKSKFEREQNIRRLERAITEHDEGWDDISDDDDDMCSKS
ncbi:homeobox protein cut [Caerostris extrusa]|uniref:DNA-binding protein SATB n=1 Tax=Caerostris extrusa TaxID=172846 RepID=A0AAV4Y975_CAEEX|nr:homeobox protein cut [Caerostris extrusa]